MNKNSSIASASMLTAPKLAGIHPEMRTLKAGDFLFRKGDRSAGIHFLSSGSLRMQRITPDGSTVVLHTARSGEFIAEASLFVDRYQCDVIAAQDAEVWLYAKDELVKRLRNDPQNLWEFTASLARSLHEIRQRYELKQIRSAPDRVLQLLRLRCGANGVYQSRGTWKDMAAELGLTHEALYRALATLEQENHIRRDAGQIQILPGKSE